MLAGSLLAASTMLIFVSPAGAAQRPRLDPETPVSSTGVVGALGTRTAPVTWEPHRRGTGRAPATATVRAPAQGPGMGIDSIIGSDDRWPVNSTTAFPHSAVVQITRNGNAHCTGWLYGANVVATAGHCVHSGGSGGTWYTSGLQIWPGRAGTSAPYGSCGALSLHSVVGWTTNANEQYDYGVIKLDCSIGNSTGWFGYWWQSASVDDYVIRICGYPGDKPSTQWCGDGKVGVDTDEQVFYANDTINGMSGSPVHQYRANCGWCSMGIHAYGVHGGGSFWHALYNHGTRITEAKFNNLWNWKNS